MMDINEQAATHPAADAPPTETAREATGFDPGFLGVEARMPSLPDPLAAASVALAYPAVAARANTDTFRFTNAAPQASGFNQSKELWLGLEDHVLEHARVNELKLSVFTGPVLADEDPPYRGIRIPLKFWKIAAWHDGVALATTGFVVDQSPLVDLETLPRELGAPPPLGPFRTFQVRIADIVALTGLVMPELVDAEHLPRGVEGWRAIESPEDILV
jgi:endonuclease G